MFGRKLCATQKYQLIAEIYTPKTLLHVSCVPPHAKKRCGEICRLVDGDDGSRHFLDLNLLTPTSCGSVTSAVYKTSTTVEMNLLKASLDLKTCWRKRHLNSMGLFLLLPDPQAMERKEYKRIEEVIGDHEWKLEQDGFQVVSMQQPAELAREIYGWAKPALA